MSLYIGFKPYISLCNECNDIAYQQFISTHTCQPYPNAWYPNESELKTLYRILKDEWINRDDSEAMQIVDKIAQLVRTFEK